MHLDEAAVVDSEAQSRTSGGMIATASSSSQNVQFRLAAFLALLAVGLGAMGAHALEPRLLAFPKGMETWKTAALYHLVHAVALVFLAGRGRCVAWWLIFSGVVVFSGTLYVYCLTQLKILAMITPVGGVLMMVGWGILAFCRPATPAA
jgi:uncharacterized membrane protein YgdD (TMEM256/DUF423 family)